MVTGHRVEHPTILVSDTPDCALVAGRARGGDAMTGGKRELDALIEEITIDCYNEDEELSGFLTYLEEALEQPVEATVIGVPATLVGVDSADGPLRGLVAQCQRDGDDYQISLLDRCSSSNSRSYAAVPLGAITTETRSPRAWMRQTVVSRPR
jgi:hypothetical protein